MARILLADDDEEIRSLYVDLLSEEHEVVTVSDGREALVRLLAGERYDLVLTDHQMPAMNGPDLIKSIRSRGFTVPVLLVTGIARPELHGADGLIRKPFGLDELREAVRGFRSDAVPVSGAAFSCFKRKTSGLAGRREDRLAVGPSAESRDSNRSRLRGSRIASFD